MKTPSEMLTTIATRAKERRLALNLTQRTLSERSGVSYSTLKKFERTGQISLESLLKLALALNALNECDRLFNNNTATPPKSLDTLLKKRTRKRGRK